MTLFFASVLITEQISFNKSIIEETESISRNTNNIAEAAERNAFISLSIKQRNADLRRSDLNLMEELRKYRKSDEMRSKEEIRSRRKTKSF